MHQTIHAFVGRFSARPRGLLRHYVSASASFFVIALGVIATGPSYALATPSPGVIDTVIGGGLGDGVNPQQALIDPRGLTVKTLTGGSRIVYIADGQNNLVRRVTLGNNPTVVTIGGIAGSAGFSGDGGPAITAQFSFPTDLVLASDGSVVVADTSNNRVRRISPGGTISTIAGTGQLATFGDGGPATSAGIAAPRGLALDSQGALYVAEFSGNAVRKISPSGVISRVAGTGAWGSSGDGGPATSASLANPSGVAVDAGGNLYIADYNNQRIRKVDTNGTISTIAGDGYSGSSGNGGAAQEARLNQPYRVVFDQSGNLLIADAGNNRVRRIQAIGGVVTGAGIISTIAGTGQLGSSGDGGASTNASLYHVNALAVDTSGGIYIGVTTNSTPSVDNRVRLSSAAGVISSVIGSGNGDGGTASQALISPAGIHIDTTDLSPNILLSDSSGNRIRRVDNATGNISTVAGNGAAGVSGDGGPASSAMLNSPLAVTSDADGTIWIADTLNNRIRKVSPAGIISTFAGSSYGYGGDNGDAVNAKLAFPYGVALASSGDLYVADFGNNRVRKITPGRIISTVAGSGTWGNSGDGGNATSANLASPTDIAVAPDGTFYLTDYSNHTVRRVRNGIIERFAGTSGYVGFSGDGGPANEAKLHYPFRLALDNSGNLFVADADNRRIRRIDAATGIITTVVGSGNTGSSGDGGLAISASLVRPTGLAVDFFGNLFISQADSFRVREVGAPPASSGLALSGSIKHFSSGAGVPQSTVLLTALNGQSSAPLQTSTDSLGAFSLTNLTAGAWSVSVSKQGGVSSSVSAIDASYALEATVGSRSLSREALLGCDANASGNLSAIDASYILQYRVGLITQLPAATACGSDWIFDPLTPNTAGITATPASLSGGNCQQGRITYANLTNSLSSQGFEAIPIGDCNLSWQATSGGAARAAAPTGRVRIGRPRVRGTHVWFPVIIDQTDAFRALEATVTFDTTVLREPTLYWLDEAEQPLIAVNPTVSGEFRFATALAQSRASGRIAWLGFRLNRERPAKPSLRLLRSSVDGG